MLSKKKIITLSIDKKIVEEFDKLSKENSLNKSLFVENNMKRYLNASKDKIIYTKCDKCGDELSITKVICGKCSK